MKKFLDLFKKKVEPIEIPSEDVVFNVNNFNKWFNDKNNNAVYAHSGIFLRLDKLSDSHITDYMEKCYGIKNGGPFLWSEPVIEMIGKFREQIREDWRKKLNSDSLTQE
jgi:hypothetical protein